MITDGYELYKLRNDVNMNERQFRPYRYLREHGIAVRTDSYDLVLRGELEDHENVKMLRERLSKELDPAEHARSCVSKIDAGQDYAGCCINVGDVLAVTRKGLTTAYYVDPTRLILLPGFFHQPASGALITIDTDNFPLDGRKGSWMTIDTLRIDGRNLFLMQSQDYGKDAPFVIVDETGKELVADRNGFTEDAIEQIRSSLKELETRQTASMVEASDKKPKLEVWQQYFENGEYLRAAEITEEQNYNMIDGTMNNRAPKRSVIERLQEKQSEVKGISSPVPLSEINLENDNELIRK